jgi:hypothetical protein
MSIEIVPMTLTDARKFVDRHHRHHRAPQGGLFAIGCAIGDDIIGVVIVGRPVARLNDDAWTAEVTRLAVFEGQPNACSMLYAAAWRACRAMGWRRLITYTLVTEPGTSLRAAGWREIGRVTGRSWNREARPRVDKHPLLDKVYWSASPV